MTSTVLNAKVMLPFFFLLQQLHESSSGFLKGGRIKVKVVYALPLMPKGGFKMHTLWSATCSPSSQSSDAPPWLLKNISAHSGGGGGSWTVLQPWLQWGGRSMRVMTLRVNRLLKWMAEGETVTGANEGIAPRHREWNILRETVA